MADLWETLDFLDKPKKIAKAAWVSMQQKEKADNFGLSPVERMLLDAPDADPKGLSKEQIEAVRLNNKKDLESAIATADIPGGAAVGSILKKGVPFKRYASVMEGQNPLELSPKEVANYMKGLGHTMRTTNAETLGSQAIDEFGTTDPRQLLKARLNSQGKLHVPFLEIKTLKEGGPSGGFYEPKLHNIGVEQVPGPLPRDQQADILGSVMHEAQHAAERGMPSKPELLVGDDIPHTNRMLNAMGAFDPSRIAEVLAYAKHDQKTKALLPEYVQRALDKGHSPRSIAQALAESKEFQGAMGKVFRTTRGNRAFRGTDHRLQDIWGSVGHMNKFKGETEMAPYFLGRQQAKLGGEMHPEWLERFPDLRKLQQEYKAPVVSGENFANQPKTQSAKAAAPWVALSLGGVGYGVKKALDHVLEVPAHEKSGEADQKVPNPMPQEKTPQDEEDRIEAMFQRVREAKKRLHPAR
jgi:hypothetical protein